MQILRHKYKDEIFHIGIQTHLKADYREKDIDIFTHVHQTLIEVALLTTYKRYHLNQLLYVTKH